VCAAQNEEYVTLMNEVQHAIETPAARDVPLHEVSSH
jgi:hypothetical protein